MSQQQTSLILGATKGLGREITELCRLRGDQTIEVGSSLYDHLEGDIIFRHCDLSDIQSVKKLLRVIEDLPTLSNFYWVAGTLLKGELAKQTQDEILSTIDINFRNSVLVANAAWKRMRLTLTGEGLRKFVVVASSSGIKPRNDEAIYVATKHAQVGFTRSLGLENRNPNVKITLVLPGGMRTRLWDKNPNPDYMDFLDPQKVAELIIETVENQTEPYMQLNIPR